MNKKSLWPVQSNLKDSSYLNSFYKFFMLRIVSYIILKLH